MTSSDMITSLASMTSTASLASKNQKLLAFYILNDFPGNRNLSSLNDLKSLNNLSGLNDLNRCDNITGLNDLNSLFGLKKSKTTCTLVIGWFSAIRNLSSLNDLNSLNDLSGLNSLISSKHLLRMILPLTWQQNDLSWSLNVEWIIKNPLFYGFLALFEVWGCGGQGCYFQPNPSAISQNSASHECTDTVFMT